MCHAESSNAVFQLVHRVAELSFGKFSFPIPLKDFLEFAVSPDTGKNQNVRLHCVFFSTVKVENSREEC